MPQSATPGQQLSNSDIALLAAFASNTVLWAEAVLHDPDDPEHKPLRLNYVEKLILSSKAKRNVIRVHRRAGKTYSLAVRALWRALTHPSSQVLIMAPMQVQVNVIFDLIRELIRVSPGLADSVTRDLKNPQQNLYFTNGSVISGMTVGVTSKGKGGVGVRGQGADEVMVDEAAYIHEGSWMAIEPIINGDAHKKEVVSWIASTPTADRHNYWRWCTEDQSKLPESERRRRVHVPITRNPDYTKERWEVIKLDVPEAVWFQEYLAEFPDIGEGVFKRSYIDRAARHYDYYSPAQVDNSPQTIPPAIRTMGVDWDKRIAGPNIVILEIDPALGKFKVVYAEEIPPHKYALTAAVERIIYLDSVFNCRKIYVDRGYGDVQVEMLHKHGLENPQTGLSEKVEGYSFKQVVEVLDPIGELVKKPIKPVMVNILVKWFEDDKFAYSDKHTTFKVQLQDYKVVATTSTGVRYSDENEHIIDASMLAGYAMYKNFADPFKFKAAVKSYYLPVPKPVEPGSSVAKDDGRPDPATVKIHRDRAGRPRGAGGISGRARAAVDRTWVGGRKRF